MTMHPACDVLDLSVEEMDSLDQVWGEELPGAANAANIPVFCFATMLPIIVPSTMSTYSTFA